MDRKGMILLLSGPIAVGKSSLADYLISEHTFQKIRTSAYLMEVAEQRGIVPDRQHLQDLGDSLDLETDFRWVSSAAGEIIDRHPGIQRWLLDSVRKKQQISDIKSRFSNSHIVFHLHLTAPEDALKARYESRLIFRTENSDYQSAISHPNEVASRSLVECADLVLDLSSMSAAAAGEELLNRGFLK